MSTDPTRPMSPPTPASAGGPEQPGPREHDSARPGGVPGQGVPGGPADRPAGGPPDAVQPPAAAPTRAQPTFQPAQPTFQPAQPTFQPAQPPQPPFPPPQPGQPANPRPGQPAGRKDRAWHRSPAGRAGGPAAGTLIRATPAPPRRGAAAGGAGRWRSSPSSSC